MTGFWRTPLRPRPETRDEPMMIASVQPQSPQTLYEQTLRKRLQALLHDSPDVLRAFRLRAFSRFEAMGFPNRRNESWKRVNLRPLLNEAFQPNTRAVSIGAEELQTHLPEPDANETQAGEPVVRLVFINGRFDRALSDLALLPPEVAADSIREVMARDPERVVSRLDAMLAEETDVFAILNMALFEDGLFLHVPEETRVEPLIQVVHITAGGGGPCAAYPHHCVILDSHAEARLMLTHIDLSSESVYFNGVVQGFSLAEGAKAECVLVFEEGETGWNLSASRASLAKNSRLELHTVTLGGAVIRHSIHTGLLDDHAEVCLNGLDVLCGKTNVHHATVTEHAAPNCVSAQFYKGILEDESVSEFNGKVIVAKGADGTDSQQLNKNLLLSENARVWTRPQLQIGADDVKCAHGATVGQLEKEQLFYLASRGLEPELAKALLIYGFAEEIIARISGRSVRKYLDQKVLTNLHPDERLTRQLGVCQ